jgi:dTDP-4-dehydrorhamnose reductase
MTRILVIGQGQLGRALVGILPLFGETVIWGRKEVDLRYPEKLPLILERLRPTVIFNAAAHNQIDAAEEAGEAEKVMVINGQAPAVLAAYARSHGVTLVHYSTDYVYDGTKKEPYLETDAPNPLNVYGRSKVAADKAIMDIGGAYYIFRSSWVYGLGGRNFPATILKLAQTKDRIEVVDNQVGAPTSAKFLALASVLAALKGPKAYGLYHLTAKGAVSWFEVAKRVVNKTNELGALLRLKPENIIPVQSLLSYPAKRPANSVLSLAKFTETFGIIPPTWEFYLDNFLECLWLSQKIVKKRLSYFIT